MEGRQIPAMEVRISRGEVGHEEANDLEADLKMKKQEGYFISIGGGRHQIPLIQKAIENNANVITVDWDEKAPGLALSKIKILESTHEYRKILNDLSHIPLTEKLLGIGCRSFGKAYYTASYLANKLGLPGPPPQSVRFLLDKGQYLKDFENRGIQVPKTVSLDSCKDKDPEKLSYPVICKPIQGNSKQGIFLISNSKEFKALVDSGISESILIQEYVYGDEVTAIGLVSESDFYLISLSDKITTTYPPFLEIAHFLPSKYIRYMGEIERTMNFIAKYLSLSSSPLLAEFKITPSGNLVLMETAPEVGGEYLADYLIPDFYGIDYFDLLYKLLTEGKVKIPEKIYAEKLDQKESAIVFRVPNSNREKSSEIPPIRALEGERIFYQSQLLEHGEDMDLSKGNLSRSYVIGVSRKSFSQPREEWLKSILQRIHETETLYAL